MAECNKSRNAVVGHVKEFQQMASHAKMKEQELKKRPSRMKTRPSFSSKLKKLLKKKASSKKKTPRKIFEMLTTQKFSKMCVLVGKDKLPLQPEHVSNV